MLGSPLINTDKAAIRPVIGIKNYEIRSQKQSCIFYLDLQKIMEGQRRQLANNHSNQSHPIGTISENHFFFTLISFPFDERVRRKRGRMKTLQWIHSKIILKQKGPIYLNYSCFNPERARE